MTRTRLPLLALIAFALTAPLAGAGRADEGMWPLNAFPFAAFEKAYGFRPSQELLDHLRLSSIRFNNGGSASFVSGDGLVITNHHVASECIQQLSSAAHDYLKEGFVAAGAADEKACPDLELNVLVGIERVTDRVRAAEPADADPAAAAAARRSEMAAIEKECQDSTGLRCDVVTLYSGGEYDLYRYRKYTDVRLAFAPEAQMAQFGGDDDNFEYPRYAVDIALFRVYDHGEPLHPVHYLHFDPDGVSDGELTFLVGNPGSTGRHLTVAELEWLRDGQYPLYLEYLDARRTGLYEFSARGPEPARIARDEIDSVENSIKAISGYESGLLEPGLIASARTDERALAAAVAADPALAAEVGDPWSETAQAIAAYRSIFPRWLAVETALARSSQLADDARMLIRLGVERGKPNGERLREYRDTHLPVIAQALASTAPIYPDFEAFELGRALRRVASQLGPVHPVVRALLGDSTPEQVAAAAVAGTRLGDPTVRRALADGGRAAVEASDDPMILLMAKLEPLARELHDRWNREVDGVEKSAGARIARAYFAVHGHDVYPDATFTLRVTFGRVEGYADRGRTLPFATRFGGWFERARQHDGKPPFDLPPALAAARGSIDPETPVDFVATHDIIGGNSGSPVVDREGRFVGIVFDGNLYMLPNRFRYSDELSRAISVDSPAIVTTLTRIYPAAKRYADELLTGRAPR
jgi:Peptidase S46